MTQSATARPGNDLAKQKLANFQHVLIFLTFFRLCSVTVLCGELLREAEFLVNQRIHPMTIIAGWRTAVAIARDALEKVLVLFFLAYFFVVAEHY